MAFALPRVWDRTAKVLAGIGALNVGTSQFFNLDALTWIPVGMFNTLAVAAVGLSGLYLLYLAFKKRV